MDYKGIKCPVCEKPFLENDDIVVCPDCGAPYHRHCYLEKGACIFTDLHENGGVWTAPPPPKAPDVTSEIKDRECPNCGVLNAHSAMFCNICGASLTGEPEQHRNTSYHVHAEDHHTREETEGEFHAGGYPPPMGGTFPGFTASPFIFDPMGGVNPMEVLEDDVTYGDVSKVVQQNPAYYMSVFRMIKGFGRGKFNFTAFLFSGGWLLMRKQYKVGTLVTVAMFVLYMAMVLLSNFVAMPIMLSALDAAGMANSAELTYLQLGSALSQYLVDKPMEYFLAATPALCMGLMLIIMLVVGFNANKLYMKHCVRTVKKIKEECKNEEEVNAAYRSRGGVNIAVTFCLFACYMVMQWIPLLFA